MKDEKSDDHIDSQIKQVVDNVLRRMLSTPPQNTKQENKQQKDKK